MIKKFFNWAAAKPSCQYTLGGGDLSFHFNRAGRLTERLLYVKPMLLGGAFMLMSVPMVVSGALPAAPADRFAAFAMNRSLLPGTVRQLLLGPGLVIHR